jgi:hypothetical protein
MLHSIKPTRVRWQGAPPGLSGRRVSSFALSKINLRPPDSEWVAQVSLLRPGFFLRNRSYRNTQVSKARPGPPIQYSSAAGHPTSGGNCTSKPVTRRSRMSSSARICRRS